MILICFFFSSRRRHTRCYRDWSSDVCSSDVKRQIDRQSSAGAKRPLYFNLLFEEELVELRPVLAEIGRRRGEVLEEWWELYQLYFGDTRTLAEPEFLRVYGADLDATGALGVGDF